MFGSVTETRVSSSTNILHFYYEGGSVLVHRHFTIFVGVQTIYFTSVPSSGQSEVAHNVRGGGSRPIGSLVLYVAVVSGRSEGVRIVLSGGSKNVARCTVGRRTHTQLTLYFPEVQLTGYLERFFLVL